MNPFSSKRLVYRAFNSPQDDEFFNSIQSDPVAFTNSCSSIARPVDNRFTENIRKYLIDNSLLFVVICKSSKESLNPSQLEPIGTVFLKSASADMIHHRSSELGIDIKKEYQQQGYGTEAIHWVLDWAFQSAGLHRVELTVLGWNLRARKLYERIGFHEEGRKREALFKDGTWWDEFQMGILEAEWLELKGHQ